MGFFSVDLISQGLVHRIGINDLPRVKNAPGIKTFFNPPEEFIIILPYHQWNKFGSYDAIPVLSAEGASEFFGKPGNFGGNTAEKGNIFRLFKVQDWSQVQFPCPGMGIINGMLPVFLHDK
jgi:hypothetical protein